MPVSQTSLSEQGCEAPGCARDALFRCGGCAELRFCSSDCATRAWAAHRDACQAAATLVGGGFTATDEEPDGANSIDNVTLNVDGDGVASAPTLVLARVQSGCVPSAEDVLCGLVARGSGAKTAQTLLLAASEAGCVSDACIFAAAELRRAGAASELLGLDGRVAVAAAYRTALRPLRKTLSLCESLAANEAASAAIETGAVFEPFGGRVDGDGDSRGATAAALALSATSSAAERSLMALIGGLLGLLGGENGQLRLAEAAAETSSAAASPAVFWHTLCGDFCRYAAEGLADTAAIARFSDLGLSHYSKAHGFARGLHAASTDVLGVALNFSVFLFEVRRCRGEAVDLVRSTLDAAADAAATLQTPAERSAGNTVCRLLEENLRFWEQLVLREESDAATSGGSGYGVR